MSTRVLTSETLPGNALDRLLSQGWYRMGPALFTCRTVTLEDGVLRTAIWTRTNLDRFSLRSSHRKTLRRLKQRYRVQHGPAQIDEAHQALYARYLTVAPGEQRREDLEAVLFGGQDSAPFDTREIALWQGEELAAFCWYDAGEHTFMSVLGAYDPDRARDSLGFGTLLLEVEQALAEGRHHHYCGYVLPGSSVMDYKLRLATEFYDPEQEQWRALEDLPSIDLCADRIQRALALASQALAHAGLPVRHGRYRYHDVGAWNPQLPSTLDHPVLLDCGRLPGRMVLVAWDLEDACYQVLHCRPARFTTTAEPGHLILLLVEKRLGLDNNPEELAETLLSQDIQPLELG